MSRFDLLPPNSTQLERDLSRATSSLERTGRPVPIIRTAKRKDIPDSVVPWLIFEYGLGEILPYLGNNQRRALEEGVLWQRIRGTPESVRIALGWIGIDGYIEESARGMQRWAEYQLGLTAATADDVIDSIAGVARISSPVRSRLQRIYAVYDRRRFVLNKSLLSGGDMLSDHSGVRLRPDWPQISYGNIVVVYVRRSTDEVDISGAHTQSAGALIRQRNRFILNKTKIGELWHKPNYPFVMSEQIGISGKYEGQVAGYFLPLSMIPADVNVIVHVGSVTEEVASYVSAGLVGAGYVGATGVIPFALTAWPDNGITALCSATAIDSCYVVAWADASAIVRIGTKTESVFWLATQLQLPMTGANDSTSFVDVSSFGRTVTPVGNARISTALGDPAGLFDGNGDYLTAPLTPPGGGDFTVEMYLQPTSLSGYRALTALSSVYNGTLYQYNNQLLLYLDAASQCVISGLQTGVMQHVAWTRTGRVNRVFLNGVPAAATYTDTMDYSASYTGSTMRIGHVAAAGTGEFYQGYMRSYRYTAASRYATAFTPPSLPFEAF